MTWNPIDFKDEPDETTPIDAQNLNYMQQGIVVAIDLATDVNEAWQDGSLNGTNGEDGKDGDRGPVGPAGRSFEIDGFAETLADLPIPTMDLQNKIWVSYEFGHLHFCDGVEWIDWGQFVGVQGERGPEGTKGEDGVFDIDQITDEQLSELHTKLTALNDKQFWSYQSHIASGQTVRFKVADLNLDLLITRTSTTIAYKFVPNNTAEPAIYYVNRLSNYDFVAWESSVTLNYQAQAIAASGFNLDASGYLAGREQTLIQVIDPSANIWYSIYFIGLGEGTMFIDVTKRVNKNREIIPAT